MKNKSSLNEQEMVFIKFSLSSRCKIFTFILCDASKAEDQLIQRKRLTFKKKSVEHSAQVYARSQNIG